MNVAGEAPLAAVEDVLATEVAGYSVLQLTVGALAVAGVIGGVRWAYKKAFGG